MNWLKSGFSALLILLLLFVGILLGIDNSDLVSLQLLNWESPPLPLMTWAVIMMMLGLCLGFLIGRIRIR